MLMRIWRRSSDITVLDCHALCWLPCRGLRTAFTGIVDIAGKTAAFDKSPFFRYHLPDLTPGPPEGFPGTFRSVRRFWGVTYGSDAWFESQTLHIRHANRMVVSDHESGYASR